MTSITLQLSDELVERAAKAAKAEGVTLERMLALLVEDALSSDEPYDLDDVEREAIEEGISDMKAGRWISEADLMRSLKAPQGQ